MARTTAPRCGRPKLHPRLGNQLCLAFRIRAQDGRFAPACQRHLTGKERTEYGITHPGAVRGTRQ